MFLSRETFFYGLGLYKILWNLVLNLYCVHLTFLKCLACCSVPDVLRHVFSTIFSLLQSASIYFLTKTFDFCSAFSCFNDFNQVFFLSPAIECSVPEVRFGNRTEGNPPFSYKSEATFECWLGYRMKGVARSVCEKSGWSTLPVCEEGKLNLLNAIMDGNLYSKVCIHDTSDE